MTRHKFYLIGSLRNPYIPELERKIIKNCPNILPFAEWYGAGHIADDAFKEYQFGLGRSMREALKSPAADHIFNFDKFHLDESVGAILVMPSGKSCHLEAGYMAKDKPVIVFFPDGEPEDRIDIMYKFATGGICYSEEELFEELRKYA